MSSWRVPAAVAFLLIGGFIFFWQVVIRTEEQIPASSSSGTSLLPSASPPGDTPSVKLTEPPSICKEFVFSQTSVQTFFNVTSPPSVQAGEVFYVEITPAHPECNNFHHSLMTNNGTKLLPPFLLVRLNSSEETATAIAEPADNNGSLYRCHLKASIPGDFNISVELSSPRSSETNVSSYSFFQTTLQSKPRSKPLTKEYLHACLSTDDLRGRWIKCESAPKVGAFDCDLLDRALQANVDGLPNMKFIPHNCQLQTHTMELLLKCVEDRNYGSICLFGGPQSRSRMMLMNMRIGGLPPKNRTDGDDSYEIFYITNGNQGIHQSVTLKYYDIGKLVDMRNISLESCDVAIFSPDKSLYSDESNIKSLQQFKEATLHALSYVDESTILYIPPLEPSPANWAYMHYFTNETEKLARNLSVTYVDTSDMLFGRIRNHDDRGSFVMQTNSSLGVLAGGAVEHAIVNAIFAKLCN